MKNPRKVISSNICSRIHDDGSQVFSYQTPGFYSFIMKCVYPDDLPFCVTDHWHDEIEFVSVTKGTMIYTIEGENILLSEGQGLFINSRILHVAGPDKTSECEFLCAILHPMLLCASGYTERNYVEPVIKNSNLKYLVLDKNTDWQKTVLDDVEKMYYTTKEEMSELTIQMLLFSVWKNIYAYAKTTVYEHVKSSHHLSTLKEMISYIQQHYKDKISLDDISASGNVGKTMCTKLFSTYVNKTPFEFLKDFRIEQSVELLKSTDLSITDISYESGFSSSSYFGECFKESLGCSPLEYRKEHYKNSSAY